MKPFFIILFLILFCSSPQIIDKNLDTVPKFTPFKDDVLANKFAPYIYPSKEFGNPTALLYRASRDEENQIHITYHFVWEKEENLTSGFSPFMSRNIYTGGLSLQKTMFGKKDIELVSLIIQNQKVIQVEYETAENYDPKKFGVKHKHITLKKDLTNHLYFKVLSWNHLFFEPTETESESEKSLMLEAKYFTQMLWEEYTMVKEKESFFKRSRAHKNYEKEFVE